MNRELSALFIFLPRQSSLPCPATSALAADKAKSMSLYVYDLCFPDIGVDWCWNILKSRWLRRVSTLFPFLKGIHAPHVPLSVWIVVILNLLAGLTSAQEKITPTRADESLERTATQGEKQLTAGDYTRTLRVGDLQRRYRVYIPEKYNTAKASPVVVVFHGGGGNPDSMIRLTGMNAKADNAGFIVVYPFGTGKLANSLLTFNGGECCGYAKQHNVDDVAFTRELLDDLAKVANVDADRVFATGLSNGGIMAHYVASELSDRIAAIAPVGGPLMMEAPRNTRPISVMHFHGTSDAFAPFQGGYGKGFLGRSKVTFFRSVEHTVQNWVKANGCNTKPESVTLPDITNDNMKVIRKTWSGGKEGSEVVLIEIQGGGHTWPGQKPIVSFLGESTMDVSANDLMWEFFQKHPRRPIEQAKAR